MQDIGRKIRIQRLIKNYSQTYMSFMLEISQATYSDIENDKIEVTVQRVYDIAEILEISPFQLLPPPKFGTGINLGKYFRTLFKLKVARSKRWDKKRQEALDKKIVYRDISKSLD